MTVSTQGAREVTLERMARDMEARRERNLTLLSHLMPEGYARFRSYEPRSLTLRLDPDQGPVLEGIRSGAPVYPEPPLAYAQNQVDAFLAEPTVRISRFAPKEILQLETEVHTRRANRAIELLDARPRDPAAGFTGFVNTLFVFGLGLGYHLDFLLEAADVHHLCIVEPDPDIFHAALSTVEWAPLVERFARPGYSLELVLERSPEEATRQVTTWLEQIGGHNAVQAYWFKHRGGQVMADTAAMVDRVVLPHFTSFLGYFDDERISLAHTTANADAGVPLLTRPRAGAPAVDDRPLFLVANGPSLDSAVDFLRENRNRGVVLSCGTALGSLVRAGIIPDIHVEMERTRPVWEWIVQATTPEERARIQLVALNPVHPEVFQLFPDAAMAARAFDLGAAWLETRLEDGVQPAVITAPGPTVGNCGLAVATALGFRDVTAFGLDLGYPVGDQHHSRYSVHYQVEDDHHEALGVYRYNDPENPTAPGNFGGEVRTTPVYVDAADRIAFHIRSHPGLTVRNTARGLRIPRTEAVAVDDLAPGPAFDTRGWVERLLARHSTPAAVRPLTPAERDAVRTRAGGLAREVRATLANEVASRADAMLLLLLAHMRLHQLGSEAENLEALLLLRGSVAHLSLLMAQALHVRADEEEALALFRECGAVLDELLEEVEVRASDQDFWRLDDKTRELDRRVAAR